MEMALGSPTEGKTPDEIFSKWGRVTDFLSDDQGGSDDTEYALFTAQLLLQKKRTHISGCCCSLAKRHY
ncbi:MAG: ADP-ribosylglycohydrolase family protein [Ignavibacteriales bacterium]|nr:ADP-ribosylglycohydrolase family protein [Ignavibacteriales bacterium]